MQYAGMEGKVFWIYNDLFRQASAVMWPRAHVIFFCFFGGSGMRMFLY